MDFLKKANTTFKSAKELEKNLASVGITKKSFTGKKGEAPPAAAPAPAPASVAEVPKESKFSTQYLDSKRTLNMSPGMRQSNAAILSTLTDTWGNAVRDKYEARKPEFEAQLTALKDMAWTIALDSAAKTTHADQTAAKTASPE